jgi:uncharacterized membrane protein HdeD (DUF308 family)
MDTQPNPTIAEHLRHSSGWLIALGIGMMVLGVLAMASPLVTGIAIAWLVGFLILCSGVARILFAVRTQQWGSAFWVWRQACSRSPTRCSASAS